MKAKILRQGDVLLVPVRTLPENLTAVDLDKGRVVLAYGEVTGHAHAIHLSPEEVVNSAVRKAQLWVAENGQRFLEVKETVALTHEEHTAHQLSPGLYEVPIQVDMTLDKMPRKVAD